MEVIKRNAIIMVSDKYKYLIMGRITYMGKNYYPVKELDEYNRPIPGVERFIFETSDDEYDFDDEWDDEEDNESTDIYLDTLKDVALEELLWTLFCEIEKGGWY